MTRHTILVLLTAICCPALLWAQGSNTTRNSTPKPVQPTREVVIPVPQSTVAPLREVHALEAEMDRDQKVAKDPEVEALFLDQSREGLPFIHISHALGNGTTSYSVHITQPVYRAMKAEEVAELPGLDPRWTSPFVRQTIAWERKMPFAMVDIYPYRKNPGTGAWERLTTFELEYVENRGAGGGGMAKDYPASSRMNVGEWYRVQVVEDGIHAVTYEMLQGMGLGGGVASDEVNLYGSHFGMLPFQNNVERPTDMVLNAVRMEDGGDGTFGPGDRIVFFATGPQRWDHVDSTGLFRHTKHLFTDTASYFVGIGVDPPSRVSTLAEVFDAATRSSDSFDDRQFIERDVVNLIKSGREFYGDVYDLTTTYNYNFSVPFLRSQDPITLTADLMGRTIGASNSSGFRFVIGGALDTTIFVQGFANNYIGMYARPHQAAFTFTASGSNLPITVTFQKHDPISSIGWMNWLRVNLRRDLKLVGDQMMFRDLTSVGAGEVTDLTLSNASGSMRIWDITDPSNAREVPFTDNSDQKTFRLHTDSLRQFVVFKPNGPINAIPAGAMPNQNLHATGLPTDLVIVCPLAFWSQCVPLAERRASEGLTVAMVTPQQVFNEFSSGMRDATAIKRYMKMLYDRAGTNAELLPRYLLLFGDGSYNNLSRAASNQNWIPTYQTANSYHYSQSYCTDDYYGLLDDMEGEERSELVDLGIGRIPVSSVSQARDMVAKILNYDRLLLMQSGEATTCSSTGDGGINDWRTAIIFASDDQEGDGFEGTVHMTQSQGVAGIAEAQFPCLNVYKIYLDAYQQFSTPGGERYPDAQNELRERVQKGALIVNYIGHGGEVGWAHERFLDNNTILSWTNRDRLPLFMTATCEFSRWDDPGRTSAGEFVMLNPNGGGIGLMTTTRIAYSQQNYALSQFFYQHVFDENDELGRTAKLGDVFRVTKRLITADQQSQYNHRTFAYIGDPSMRLAVPRNHVDITAVTDTLGNPLDTLKALSTVRISGVLTDNNGQPMTDMNGIVVPTVYDKLVPVSTLANDGGSPFNFTLEKNIIYRGKATVTNGAFTFTFVVPKDIAYQIGPGRVSCYAEDYTQYACGGTRDILVGGTATDVALDDEGPDIGLFMNDERFVRGGITDEEPLLLVKLFDDNGINTLGNSIGHDLVAVLDANTDQAIVLNDLYEADLDTYKSGKVRYRFGTLEEGRHELLVKAWDVFNNSSVSTTEFVVSPSAELALEHVLNYPNPFTTYTEFFFEHNRPCATMDVQVQVFTVSGRLVKTLNRRLACDGFRSEPMAWDGRDDVGDKLGRGVYVYRLNVATPEGVKAEKFEKLVILR